MVLADGTLVAVAEHLRIERVFTLDHRDFNLYKPAHVKHFKVFPA
jgi:predicted nucleic acid-binding protein